MPPQSSRFKVTVTARALGESAAIAAYLIEHAPALLDPTRERVAAGISSLARLPLRHVIRGTTRRGNPVRAVMAHPYLIYYSVEERRRLVRVLRIVHGVRRQPRRF